MLNKLKQIKISRRGIYISLAICMLLLGGIGIFTAIRNMNKIIDESDFVYQAPNTDKTVFNPTVTDAPDNDIKDVATEEIPIVLNFNMPTKGEVIKNHSGNELVYSNTMNDYRTHNGIDILSNEGEAVYSAESGKIVNIENHPLWGTSVVIEHENGYQTCYKNLSVELPVGIEEGSYVSSGGLIGSVGTSALVEIGEEPHLHFEMYVDGNSVDPLEYIS